MRHIIWRNRASAILGLMVVLIPFSSFPNLIEKGLLVILGSLIVLFGLTSNKIRQSSTVE